MSQPEPPRRTFGALFRVPYGIYLRWLYATLAERGFPEVREAHTNVFRHIEPGGSRVTDLAAAAGMTKQSMAYLVDYLQETGYLDIVPDETDRRAKRARLTKRGEALMAASRKLGAEFEARAARLLGKKDMAELRRLLERLSDRLEAPDAR